MAGLGCGLPLSRLYAEYMGGRVKLQTMPRWKGIGIAVGPSKFRMGFCMFLSYEIESIDIYGYLLSTYCIIVCNCEPEKYLGYLTVQISLGNHLPLSTPGRYGTDVFVYLNSLGSRRSAPSHHCQLVGHNYVSFSENNMFQPSNHWWSCCLKTALRSKELW